MKSKLILPFAWLHARQVQSIRRNALADQQKIFRALIKKAQSTSFGRDHHFEQIKNHEDYSSAVPLRDYEGLKSYFDRITEGERDVLWPGVPKYLAKTSGTTSGVKYIPITTDSLPNHIDSARLALLNYAARKGQSKLFDGKVMFLSGSPEMSITGGINTGRLSGIVNHEIPSWLKGNQLPSYQTNCISDWEKKLDKIVEETIDADLRLISGIPPWVQMYFERILSLKKAEAIKEVFPHLQLFIFGGVNYEPYRSAMESLIGEPIDSLETYPASEGFIAFQDLQENEGLLLNTRSGIFFEFVPAGEVFQSNPQRLTLKDVETDIDYAVIINNNAGLWSYILGDTVRFVHINPFRLVVSGRIKHFISAFGEHVIGKEVEEALIRTCQLHDASVREYTVAPQVNPPGGGTPYHEWYIEFDQKPLDTEQFRTDLDNHLRGQNIYYDDLVAGNILTPLRFVAVAPDTFRKYMKLEGKLGGQNKVPRLSNDRKIVDRLDEV